MLTQGQQILIEDPAPFDGVRVIGVDGRGGRFTCRGDNYLTVIIGPTPVHDGASPTRLLDMVEGSSKQVFQTWLKARPDDWKDSVEGVAMDGFTGLKTVAEGLRD